MDKRAHHLAAPKADATKLCARGIGCRKQSICIAFSGDAGIVEFMRAKGRAGGSQRGIGGQRGAAVAEMQLAFRPDKAPRHVENFVKLCLQGFYDGTKFHRVIRNFMVQGGCPNTKDDDKKAMWGSGGPGYRIDAEFNDLRHLKGTLSMARTQDPNSAGSGFFLVHKESPHLDNQYSAFGNLVEGVDVLDAIANVQVGGPQKSTPVQPVVLSAAVVLPVTKK